MKCNLTPTVGDGDLGNATGLPVPIVVDPGQTFDVRLRLNSGSDALGAFSVEIYYDSTMFEVPSPSGDNLEVLIAADAAAINDPSPGTVKVTVVPAEGSNLTGATDVAIVTLKALNTKQGAPVYSQLTATILEMYENCPDATCPAIEGAWGPAPRAIDAGVVSIDPVGNLAEKGDFNGDGQFGVADLQAVVNYVVAPADPQFAGYDLDSANIFPDTDDQAAPKVQAFDAYYGAMISVGLSHFVEVDYEPSDVDGIKLSVEVRDGSAQPAPVTQNLIVTFEVGLTSGASVAGLLTCGAGCSPSADADGAPITARQLYVATHVGSGVYEATVPAWESLPSDDFGGVVVILQNTYGDASPKGDPKVYLRTPFENVESPFDPLLTIPLCDVDVDCEAGYHCAEGMCQENAGEGEACTADFECAGGLHCNETEGICEADKEAGEACVEDSDCVDSVHCNEVAGLCENDKDTGEACVEDSDCIADSCIGGVCCEVGNDCCLAPEDCPAEYSAEAVCDTPASCQGSRLDATCMAGICGSLLADDDSGCTPDTITSGGCEPYAGAACTGEEDQGPPDCADSCVDDTGCADTAFCVSGQCGHVLCELTGNQGELADCVLHLARGSQAYTKAAMLQFKLAYDEAELTPDTIEVCGELAPPFNLDCTPVGGECDPLGAEVYCDPVSLKCSECEEWDVSDGTAELSSGHTVETCAQPPPNCTDGSFQLLFWGMQSLPITDAYLAAGQVQGVSEFMTLKFSLDVTIAGAKVAVDPDGFTATDSKAKLLVATVRHGGAGNPDHFIVTEVPLD